MKILLVESGRALGSIDTKRLGTTVGKREAEVARDELLDVGTADVLCLLDLSHLQDLDFKAISVIPCANDHHLRGWRQSEHGVGQPYPGTSG